MLLEVLLYRARLLFRDTVKKAHRKEFYEGEDATELWTKAWMLKQGIDNSDQKCMEDYVLRHFVTPEVDDLLDEDEPALVLCDIKVISLDNELEGVANECDTFCITLGSTQNCYYN